jgi:hypothetical protein
MNPLRGRALTRLDALIEGLSRPLPSWHPFDSNRRGGWTEESRRDWLEQFRELRARVEEGGPVHDEGRQLARWLDHSGITSGPWFRQALALQTDLWDLAKSEAASRA